MQPRIVGAFFATGEHFWLKMIFKVTLLYTRTFSANLLPSQSVPSTYWCVKLFLPRHRTLHFLLLSWLKFLFAQPIEASISMIFQR